MVRSTLAVTKRVRQFFSTSVIQTRHPYAIAWLSASILFATTYSLMGMQEALSSSTIVPDDARQHLFWTQRFVDPELFANDYIADYYQAIAPAGYTWLYRSAAIVGIDPLLFNKLLPVGLSLLTAVLGFWTCMALFPFPSAAFISTVLLSQSLSVSDTVFSGTPKAFLYVTFLAFTCSWLRRSWWCLGGIVLEGLFYPPAVLVSAGVMALGLLEWRQGRLRWSGDRGLWRLGLAGLAIAIVMILPYVVGSDGYGPTMSGTQARLMSEFQSGGRVSFFKDDPMEFWLHGRSGLRLNSALTPVTNLASLGLLVMPWFPQRFPLVRRLSPQAGFLPRLFCTSLGLFFAAHLLLFKLYLPSRYSGHYLRITFSLAAGIALCIAIDALLARAISLLGKASSWSLLRGIGCQMLALAIALSIVGYTLTIPGFPITYFARATQPDLYAFLESQPKDSLIATLSGESSYIPLLAKRSVFVGREFAIPYQVGYYGEIARRAHATIEAQYSAYPSTLRAFIEDRGINLWLLDRDSFSIDTVANNGWIAQYHPTFDRALAGLERGEIPILQQLADRCTEFENPRHSVLSADCIVEEIRVRYPESS